MRVGQFDLQFTFGPVNFAVQSPVNLFRDGELVGHWEEGRWPDPKFYEIMNTAVRAALRRAGLPRFRLYDLRHTYASHLLAEGAPLPYVAAQLGHAKPTTTLAHYTHFLPRGDRAWADRLEAARSADNARLNARASKVATGRQTV